MVLLLGVLASATHCKLEEGRWNLRTPLASLGAVFRHDIHSFEEHGISCRKYNSRTIFWTLPLFVDRTYTLLEIFDA